MAQFLGYLLKNNITGSTDNSFIALESYNSTPNQREELVAYRDENTRDLTRVTADGMKTAINFSSIAGMDLLQKMAMQEFFNSAMVDEKQRKVDLTYWNDEENTYKRGYFYLPDISFTIIEITSDNIYYDAIDIGLVEY